MSPVFRRENEYTFKIYSNEEERMHIHVLCGRHEGKSIKYIAEKMGRSQTSIAMRLGKLGVE